MERAELVVIGAGISGLSFAHMASQRGITTLVLEKSDRAGGCFHSHRFLGPSAEFWLELGAHTCYNSYGSFIGVLEELHLTSALLPRQKVSFKMLIDGKLCSIPSQLNFFELACSLPRLLTQNKAASSVVDYYAPIVGRRNYERLFSPAFNAVLSQR
ncbi:MAG TPA: FAD-dependent oxidoreductase, partial [Geobacterales bacterium]|nr:FAD-dependent oxidoreductase [Geobacterales bacterium]